MLLSNFTERELKLKEKRELSQLTYWVVELRFKPMSGVKI